MKSLTGLFALTLSLGLATAASAAPNLLGPTGLLLTPTTEVLNKNAYNVSLHSFEGDIEYAFNYGIAPKVEFGFSRFPNEETVINAKYNILPETAKAIGVSAGVMDLTGEMKTTLYAVASKTFITTDELDGIQDVKVDLGLAAGDSDEIPLSGLFGGVAIDLTKSASLMFEYDGDDFNYGGRYDFGHGIVGQLGFVGPDHDFAIGASYSGNL